MALSDLLEKSVVVGFEGVPIVGACGLRSPLFRCPRGFFFAPADPPAEPSFLSEGEVSRLAEQGRLVRVDGLERPRIEGGVILFAHRQFLAPEDGSLVLSLAESHLTLPGGHGCYLARKGALEILRQWGELLLGEADRRLKMETGADFKLAFQAAQRARYCAPPSEHRALRLRVFARLLASWEALGRPAERVLRDARRDFPDEAELREIRAEADRLRLPAHAAPSMASHDPLRSARMRMREPSMVKRPSPDRRAA